MRKEGKSGKSERRKRNRKLMANLVSNYKNFKGESAPAKMAILDGTSTGFHDYDKYILCSEDRKWQPGQETQIFCVLRLSRLP